METGMIVITTILIALCASPFILLGYNTKKRENQLKKELSKAVEERQGALTDCTINKDYIIGLDALKNHVYFYKKSEEATYFQNVNLNEIASCEVKKISKRVRNGKTNSEIIQSITLEFIAVNGQVMEQFKLYDYDKDSQLNGQIELANDWKKTINSRLENIEQMAKSSKPVEDNLTFA